MARIPAEQRRQDLIAAAFRVMARDGVAAASTRAICGEAGVAQSVFHYCFRSKEELLRDLTVSVVVAMASASHGTTESSDDLEQSLLNALQSVLDTAIEDPDRHLVLYELTTTALRDRELAELAAWQYEQYYQAATLFLGELAEHLGVEWTLPLPMIARLFVAMIDGVILGWLANRDSEQASAVLVAYSKQLSLLAVTSIKVGLGG